MRYCFTLKSPARLLKGLIIASFLLLAVGPASAANRQDQARLARKACLNGDYSKGVSILSDLFVDTQDVTYIFNQGRCLEQNRQYEQAIARFEEYLVAGEAKLEPKDRAAAEKHIADCKRKLPKEYAEPPLQPPVQSFAAPPSPPPAPPRPVASEPAPQVIEQPAPQPAEGERRWGLVTAGIITTVVGAGGMAAGVIFNLKSNDAARDLERKVGAYPAKSDDEKRFKTFALVGYGAGAACVVTGTILIAIGAVKSSPSSTTVSFVPAFGPGQVGAVITGAF